MQGEQGMNIDEKIAMLYEKDTALGYKNLLELETLSEIADSLSGYIDNFISMLDDKSNVIKVRGFRLLCKQARWDKDRKIDANIKKILLVLNDPKPTTVRQALQFLKSDVMPYKKELHKIIKESVSAIDLSRFNANTMRPLIEKDIEAICQSGE